MDSRTRSFSSFGINCYPKFCIWRSKTKNYCPRIWESRFLSIPFFLTLKNISITWDKGKGSSITKRTRSRDALANKRRSLNKRVQYCRALRPSTLVRSPPKIHCRPGLFNTKGYKKLYCAENIQYLLLIVLTLHLVKTNLFSKSWTVSKGLPSPTGSINPALDVISL